MVQMITMEELNALRQEILDNLNELKLIVSGARKPTPEKRFLKTADLRKILHVSSGKLQKMRDLGQIPYKKVDGVIFYDLLEVERILNER